MNVENTLYAGLPVLTIYEFRKEPMFEEGGCEVDLFTCSKISSSHMSERGCFESVVLHELICTDPESFSDEALELMCLNEGIYVKFIDE